MALTEHTFHLLSRHHPSRRVTRGHWWQKTGGVGGRGVSPTPPVSCYYTAVGIRSTQLPVSEATVPVLPPSAPWRIILRLPGQAFIRPSPFPPRSHQSGHAASLLKTIRHFPITFKRKIQAFYLLPKALPEGPEFLSRHVSCNSSATALSGLRHLGLCAVLGKLGVF